MPRRRCPIENRGHDLPVPIRPDVEAEVAAEVSDHVAPVLLPVEANRRGDGVRRLVGKHLHDVVN